MALISQSKRLLIIRNNTYSSAHAHFSWLIYTGSCGDKAVHTVISWLNATGIIFKMELKKIFVTTCTVVCVAGSNIQRHYNVTSHEVVNPLATGSTQVYGWIYELDEYIALHVETRKHVLIIFLNFWSVRVHCSWTIYCL